MDLTFQEKSIWTSLITTVVLFGIYFIMAFQVLAIDDLSEVPAKFTIGALFTGVVIAFVVIEVVVHIVLALSSPPEIEDERSKLISLKATRNAAIVLAIGVWLSFFGLAFTTYNPMIVAHLLLSFFIMAEIVRFSSKLIYFRMGV